MRILYFLVFLFINSICFGYSIKDFLCGCDYCNKQINTPALDIASHYMNCETLKKNKIIKKLIQAQNKKDIIKPTQNKDEKPISIHEQLTKEKQENQDLTKQIKEKDNFISMLQQSSSFFINGWIYEPNHFNWIYVSKTFAPYIYSEELGWIFIKKEYYYIYDKSQWKKMPSTD